VHQREGAGEDRDHGDDADEAHVSPLAEFCKSLKVQA
jgi:hypothetical protein